jgi:hypothetical protein
MKTPLTALAANFQLLKIQLHEMLKVVIQLFFREHGQKLRFGRSVDFTDAVNQFSFTHALLFLVWCRFYQLPWEVSAIWMSSLEEQAIQNSLRPISISTIYGRG